MAFSKASGFPAANDLQLIDICGSGEILFSQPWVLPLSFALIPAVGIVFSNLKSAVLHKNYTSADYLAKVRAEARFMVWGGLFLFGGGTMENIFYRGDDFRGWALQAGLGYRLGG